MNIRLSTALLTGFGLGGVVGGVLLTNVLSSRTDKQRRSVEDDRRWLADRRKAYAAYLALVVATLADMERASGDKKRELEPALSEVQLIAGKDVAELADRTSSELMELTGFIDAGKAGDVVGEYSSKARYLVDALRNAMREELGVSESIRTFPRPEGWPWLEDDSKEIPDDGEAVQLEPDVTASEQPPPGTLVHHYPKPDRSDTVRGWMVG